VAADSAVGAAEVAWFARFVQRAEGVGNVLWELRAGGGVGAIGEGSFGFAIGKTKIGTICIAFQAPQS
jgi:hypothetical protein